MLGAEMNDRLDLAHGHTMDDLLSLLKSEWRTDAKGLHLDSCRLSGMSNLNILIHSVASSYVLKLPGLTTVFETNPFESEFYIALHLAENGLGPTPLCVGRLQDEKGTPFVIRAYEPGVVHASLSDISLHELDLVKTSLDRLASLHIPDVPSYPSARHYAARFTNKMNVLLDCWNTETSELSSLVCLFRELEQGVAASFRDMSSWNGKTMHGDLRPDNIIFQQDRALLLDVGACCVGNPLYDIAYLSAEPLDAVDFERILPLLAESDDSAIVTELTPLALFSALAWTLERLVHLDSNKVEENLSGVDVEISLRAYFESKAKQLRMLLEGGSLT
jgi:aminoglycoside phosphotransferase (APT) family kinase protein